VWEIRNPEIRPSKLDFSSSGQGKRDVFQLFAGDIKLINAIELVGWNEADSQFLICEACGMPGCKSRDWVSVRRSDSLVLFLPSSEYVWRGKNDYTEHCPPAYFKQRGVPYLDSATYESLRSKHSSFPTIDQLQPLKLKEATALFQWTAPDQILGEPPEVNVRPGLFVGASEGDPGEQLNRLEALVKKQYASDDAAILRSVSANEGVISFYLDAAAFTEWQAMAFDGSEYRLLVESKYVADPVSSHG
jgi:hypothetical protein